MGNTRITLILRDDDTVGTHIEAAEGAEPMAVLTRAIAALEAERKALPNCPTHRGPTFRQQITALARFAQSVGEPLDRRVRYGHAGKPLQPRMLATYRRRAAFWLAAASSLRGLALEAKKNEEAEANVATPAGRAALRDGGGE